MDLNGILCERVGGINLAQEMRLPGLKRGLLPEKNEVYTWIKPCGGSKHRGLPVIKLQKV
jgi:hypothetical protein